MKTLMRILMVLIGINGLVLCPSAFAKEKTYALKFGHSAPFTKEWTFYATPVSTFKEEVESRSKGRIKVEIYPRSQLGGMESMVNQVRQGVIQATNAADGHFATLYPKIEAFGIPYLFIDRVVAWDILHGPLGDKVKEDMAKTVGLRPIAWFDNGGFRNFSNSKRPIKTADDMKGLKIRTMNSPMHMEIVRNLGGSPTPINWGELYSSLQTGVVDGQENSISVFRMPKLEEVQKYIILDGHVFSLIGMMMNEKWYQSLPDDLKAVIDQSAQIATTVNHALSVLSQSKDIKELTAIGIEIYDPPIEVKRQFMELTQKPAIEWLKKKVDPEWVDEVLAEVSKAEKKQGY